jgi:hypothetical protein
VEKVAMGFGAFMADDSWTDQLTIHGRTRPVGRRLPTRYLRTALVARGFFDGYTATRAGLRHFHFLGLGAPIMVPIVALAANGTIRLTFDATSPIKDAVTGSLYTTKPAPLTVRSWNIAHRLATGELARWSCPCRFCTDFLAAPPVDRPPRRPPPGSGTAGRLTAADLKAGTPAGEALPLFRIGRDPLGLAAENIRIGHNHWALGTLTRAVQDAPDLHAFVTSRVEQYAQHAGAAHFAHAVQSALQIAAPTSDFWS